MAEIETSIAELEQAAKQPSRQRQTSISILVEEICEYAYQSGLSPAELERVINIIAVRNELDQTSITTLIKNLYPQGIVTTEVVLVVVGSLGQGTRKTSPATQTALVRWLCLVLDLLEDSSILSKLYGTLYDLLDLYSIRKPLCHLLGQITRRKHVRPYRIQFLLELCQQTGFDQSIVDLLLVFKNFCPEIILASSTSRRGVSFTQSNVEWTNHAKAIQAMNVSPRGVHGVVSQGFKISQASREAVKGLTIPRVHSINPEEDTVTLEEITDVKDFVGRLEYINPPSQVVAALRDPLLQKYMLITPGTASSQRMSFWLAWFFDEELETLKDGFGNSPTLAYMLQALAIYTDSTKVPLDITWEFLNAYLPLWDGVCSLGTIIDLLVFAPLQNFQVLHATTLSYIDRAVVASGTTPIDTLIQLYAQLLCNWTAQFRRMELKSTSEEMSAAQDSLVQLNQHITTLTLSALTVNTRPSATMLMSLHSIAFTMRKAFMDGSKLLPLSMPSPYVLYLLVMSSDLNGLDQVCALLAIYKQCFELEFKLSDHALYNEIQRFNGYLMDTCNLIWRAQALSSPTNRLDVNKTQMSSNAAALGCLCPPVVYEELKDYLRNVDKDYNLGAIFGLSHNGCTTAVSHAVIGVLEQEHTASTTETTIPTHSGPASPMSLEVLRSQGGPNIKWLSFRAAVLSYLGERDVRGIRDLMTMTMKKDLSNS